jgi:hypothetical protein
MRQSGHNIRLHAELRLSYCESNLESAYTDEHSYDNARTYRVRSREHLDSAG